MSRWTVGLTAICLSVGLTAASSGQTNEPRGRTFSQGGGWTHAPREHYVAIPGYPTYLAPAYPVWNYGGYPVNYGTVAYPGYYWPYPLSMSQMPNSPMTAPPNALPAQRNPWETLPAPKSNPALRPVLPSSAAARTRALNYLAEGDQHLRKQMYQHAYASYRQAANLADDLPDAHLRYGIVLAMLNRQDRAANEFRRAVHIDPSLPNSKFSLETLFGPDSQLVRSSIISRLRAWVDEDVADPERLFVLGVMMHFNEDARAQTLFSAAARLTGNAEHVVAFLPRVPMKTKDVPPAPGLDNGAALPPAPLPAAPEPDDSLNDSPRPGGSSGFLPRSTPKSTVPKSTPKDDGPLLLPPLPR